METSIYERRPWLELYSPDVPAELPLPQQNPIDQFRHTARQSPGNAAIYYFDTVISFGELNSLSSALAQALQDLGVQPQDRVALLLQNMPQFWIAQLAVWKVGAIVVPLNPMFKAQELIYHLGDSGAKVLIALESLYQTVIPDTMGQTPVQHYITTADNDMRNMGATTQPQSEPAANLDLLTLCQQYKNMPDPVVPVSLSDIALMIYTSGTTGRPKGAMNTHANIAFNAEVYRVWMQLAQGDVIIGAAPVFHITGAIGHLAVAALVGIPVILNYRFDAGELLHAIEQWHGTFLVASITVYIALMNYPQVANYNLGSLRKAFSGGAPIAVATIEQFRALTGIYIHNLYGLTETTSPSHAVPFGVTASVDAEWKILSIGVPVPNTVVKIVELDSGVEVAPGTHGEIIIKGPMIVPGYWQKPTESAQAIRDGWLYTGDIGWMDERGWFYIIDRKKDVIIASGFKVWPREVEDMLYQHPSVREAAVVGVPDPYRGETVKAFVSLKVGNVPTVTPDELIAFCKERLAAYKYPRLVEIVDEIPKTATGKILRRELRNPVKPTSPQKGVLS